MDGLVETMRGEGFRHEVTDSTRLEGGGGLEVLEFEVDVAVWCQQAQWGIRGLADHPASRERAEERMRGVSIHGF